MPIPMHFILTSVFFSARVFSARVRRGCCCQLAATASASFCTDSRALLVLVSTTSPPSSTPKYLFTASRIASRGVGGGGSHTLHGLLLLCTHKSQLAVLAPLVVAALACACGWQLFVRAPNSFHLIAMTPLGCAFFSVRAKLFEWTPRDVMGFCSARFSASFLFL